MDEKVSFIKLNGKNYDVWKFKMEMYLIDKEIWDAIITERPKITVEGSEAAQKTWDKMDRSARAKIVMCIDDNQLIYVKHETNAKNMWENLAKVYEKKHLNTKLFLQRKLYNIKYIDTMNMNDYIHEIMNVVDQLRGIGKIISEDDIVALMLCGLTESYDALITSLEGRPASELSLEYVQEKLISTYERRLESSKIDDAENAMKTMIKHKNENVKYKPKFRCYHCGKLGHKKNFCYVWKQEERNKKNEYKAKKITEEDDIEEINTAEEVYQCFKITSNTNIFNWYIDSAASTHMTNNKEFYVGDIRPKSGKVKVANGQFLDIQGIGDGILEHKFKNGRIKRIQIYNVIYVPGLDSSLLSVKRLDQSGYFITFGQGKCTVIKDNELITEGLLERDLYKININEFANKVEEHKNCIHEWHRIFGHRDPQAIIKLNENKLVKNLKIRNCDYKMNCLCCMKAKITQISYPKKSYHKSTKTGDLFHADLCGPMKTKTPTGKCYFLTLIDDKSRFLKVYLLSHKNETTNKIIEFLNYVSTKNERIPKVLRTDRGGEFVNDELKKYLKRKGIEHQLTVPYSPPQNGIAERRNRYLTEMARSMLNDSGLDRSYWGAAIITASYIQNCLPTKACDKTPFEEWYGRKPNVNHMKIFGCKVIYYIPTQRRTKLENRGKEGIFIGYADKTKGYLILDQETKKVIISRSIKCVERGNKGNLETVERKDKIIEEENIYELHDKIEENEIDDVIIEENEVRTEEIKDLRRSERTNKGIPPNRYIHAYKTTEEVKEPLSWKDLQSFPEEERIKWIRAANDEIKSMEEKEVWELKDLPEGRKVIDTKWIFKAKQDQNGKVSRYKARLVARGFTQKPGEDFKETFAPVANNATFRVLLYIAVSKKMKIKHFDVKTAFLNGKLKEDLYIKQPEGYLKNGSENKVYKLKKSLYGLKQAAKAWNETINDVLTKNNFTRSKVDQCLYTRKEVTGWSYLLLYVDDILIAVHNQETENEIAQIFRQAFEITDLGEVTYYIGVQIERNEDGSFKLNQRTKINQLIKRFGLNEAKEADIPMNPEYLKDQEISPELPDNNLYREAIGSLLYLSTVSRPDIATAVGILSRKVSKPTVRDWTAVKQIFRYLKKTADVTLYIKKGPEEIHIYVDADWAGNIEDRKSTSGYIIKLGTSSIIWASRKQVSVSLSSTEAEFIAASEACKEGLWLIQLLKEFNIILNEPIKVFEDNQGCIAMIKTERVNQRSKHIDVRYSFIRDLYNDKIIDMHYCQTENMIADILTKPLSKIKFKRFCELLNLYAM